MGPPFGEQATVVSATLSIVLCVSQLSSAVEAVSLEAAFVEGTILPLQASGSAARWFKIILILIGH